MNLSTSAIEALRMIKIEPRLTWRCNMESNGWIGGRTAASLIRKGLAKYIPAGPNSWEHKVQITPEGIKAFNDYMNAANDPGFDPRYEYGPN